ncbi:MAG: hypothetical protein ACRDQB_04715 [Thermocrispum sp.]
MSEPASRPEREHRTDDDVEDLGELVKRNGEYLRKAALPAVGAAALAAFFIAKSRKGRRHG